MTPDPSLSVIIVNWNAVRWLDPCLRTVLREGAGRAAPEVVVVDNASDDGCAELLAARYPEVVFVPSAENVGFARANNLGVRHASGSVLLFLNPDTEVREGALHTMLTAFAQLPVAGALGCRLLNTDGSVQTSAVQTFPTPWSQFMDCELLRRLFPRAPLWGVAPLLSPASTPAPVEVVSGACLMVSRAAFEAVGGFSEDYFMYAEDLDLCRKLHAAGLRNYLVSDAQVFHHGGSSSAQRPEKAFASVQMRESVHRYLVKFEGAEVAERYRKLMRWSARLRLACLALGGGRHQGSMAKWRAIGEWAGA